MNATGLLLAIAGFVFAAEERVLHFPAEHSVGVVYTRPHDENWHYLQSWKTWKRLGQAQGEIRVAADQDVRLSIELPGTQRLDFLGRFGPDDIDAIEFGPDDHDRINDEQLAHIARLTGLRELDLSYCPITDSGFAQLANLKKLRSILADAYGLDEERFGIGDGAVAIMAELPEIEAVDLRATKVTDAGLRLLAQAKTLRYVGVSETSVTDEGIEHLAALPRLEELRVSPPDSRSDSEPRITDRAMRAIGRIASLKSLQIESRGISENGLAHLQSLNSLRSLRSYGISITDVGVTHLAKIKSLREIVAHLELTEKGVASLATLPELEQVSLYGSGITDEAMKTIGRMDTLTHLDIQHSPVSDAGLACIAKLPRLHFLEVYQTLVSGDGLAVLRDTPTLDGLIVGFGELDGTYRSPDPHLRGVGKITHLRTLNVVGGRLISNDFGDLRDLIGLESLIIWEVMVDDQAAAVIGGMTSLKHLEIDNGAISDIGLENLSNLHRLEYLNIKGLFTNKGIVNLLGFPALERAFFYSRFATQEAAESLKKMPSMRWVEVRSPQQYDRNFTFNYEDHVRRAGTKEDRRDLDAMEGKPAPALQVAGWVNTDGKEIRLEEFQGRVVLVDFWATWCGPCREAFPKLAGMHEKYADRGLVVVGVHATYGQEEMESWLKENSFRWPMAYDRERQTQKAWSVRGYPSFYLIDRKGTLRMAAVYSDDVERAVVQLLDEK